MNLYFQLIHPIADRISELLLNGVILSLVLFFGARLALASQQRFSAAVRHRIWFVVLLAIAAAPAITFLKPKIISDAAAATMIQQIRSVGEIREIQAATDEGRGPSATQHPPSIELPLVGIDWSLLLVAAWALMVCVFLVRLLVALASLWLLHRRARAVWVPELSLPRSKRRFRICESDAVAAPTAIGLWSPKILLPPGFASALATDELRQVVRHEAAHLDRRDDWTNLVQHLILALMPINPFIWCVFRRLRLEREMACDDRVLAELPATKQYARLLTRLAVCRTTSLTLASGVGQSGRQLYQRIARILDRRCNRESRMSPGALTCASFGLVGSGFVALAWLPVVAIAPRPATDRFVNAEAAPIRDCSAWKTIRSLESLAVGNAEKSAVRQAVRSLAAMDTAMATGALLRLLKYIPDEDLRLFIIKSLGAKRLTDPFVRDRLLKIVFPGETASVEVNPDNRWKCADDAVVGPRRMSKDRNAVTPTLTGKLMRLRVAYGDFPEIRLSLQVVPDGIVGLRFGEPESDDRTRASLKTRSQDEQRKVESCPDEMNDEIRLGFPTAAV